MGNNAEREQTLKITYGRRFNERYARFYSRVHSLFFCIQLIGALGAIGAFFKEFPELTIWAGLVMAVATAMDIAFRPSEKAAIAKSLRRSYISLSRQRRRLTEDEVDDEIARLQEEGGNADLESLRNVALNDALSEMGYSKAELKEWGCRENPFNWFFRLVA